MTARPQDTHTPACPCGHENVPAEQAGQRPLLEHAATGDREAFARLYDTQVDGVYRYLLAWTGDLGEAADLTAEVFHSAMGWLPATSGPEGEAGAWLTAMARDALAQREAGAGPPEGGSSPGPNASPATVHTPGSAAAGTREPAGDAVAAVARLREPEREVAVLRLLLGHSLDHTAHLSGYSRRAAMELQLAACLAIHELTGGTPTGSHPANRATVPSPPASHPAPSAEEFERRLGRWEVDRTGSNPVLAAALTAANSVRRAAPGHVTAPPSDFVQRLRNELVTGTPTTAAASPATGIAARLATGIGGTPATGIGGDPASGDAAAAATAARTTATAGIATAAAPGAVDSPEHRPVGSATVPLRGPQQPEVAGSAARGASPPPEVVDRAAPVVPMPTQAAGNGDPVVPTPPGIAGSGASVPSRPRVVSDSTSPARPTRAGAASRRDHGVTAWLDRRPWAATGVAAAGTLVVLALQVFGGSGQPTACTGPGCSGTTTRVVAAGGGTNVGTPLTTVVESSTTSSTVVGEAVVAPSSAAPRTSANTTPPTTRPATTAPPTTAAPRPTTSAPTTTTPPTSPAPTTTTVAPAPT